MTYLPVKQGDYRYLDAQKQSEAAQRDAQKLSEAYEAGMLAVITDELVYRPPAAEKEEGLNFGPAASADKEWRHQLQKKISPAFGKIVAFSRKVFEWKDQIRETLKNEIRAELKLEMLAASKPVDEFDQEVILEADDPTEPDQTPAKPYRAGNAPEMPSGRSAGLCEAPAGTGQLQEMSRSQRLSELGRQAARKAHAEKEAIKAAQKFAEPPKAKKRSWLGFGR